MDINISGENGGILSYKTRALSEVHINTKKERRKDCQAAARGLLLGIGAAAWADPRSLFWEEGQKGIFVLIKGKHSKLD